LQSGWWPTFNLADTFLDTGFIVLALAHAIPADEIGHQASPRGDLSE